MKTQTLDTIETINKIRKSAKAMQQVREITSMAVGEVARQGDIYIERIAKIESKGKEVKSRQLAPGTTKGSRHIVSESPKVKLYESKPDLKTRALFQVGPAIEAKEELIVSHPEHAFIKLPAGTYQVWFQADFNRKERAKD